MIKAEADDLRPPVPKFHGLSPYNMTDPGATILQYYGTIIPLVLLRFEIWLFTAAHVLMLASVRFGLIPAEFYSLGTEPWKMMAATSSLLAFFVVFFSGQCFARFSHLYDACTRMMGMMQVIASMTSVHLENDPETRWQGLRYLGAAVLILYAKVNDGDVTRQGIDESEWTRLMSYETIVMSGKTVTCPPLLSELEVAKLKDSPIPAKFVDLITWSLHVFRKGYKSSGQPDMMVIQLQGFIYDLRGACATVLNTLNLPVPFAYFHLLLTLQYFTYFTIAMTLVNQGSLWTPAVLFCVILVTTGVREVAVAMSDPFGDDQTDLPVEKFVRDLRGFVSLYATMDTRPPVSKGFIALPKAPIAKPMALAERDKKGPLEDCFKPPKADLL